MMENQKSKKGLIVLAVVFVALLIGASAVYPMLTAQVAQQNQAAQATAAPTAVPAQEAAPAVTMQPAAQATQAPQAAKKPAEVAGPVMKNMARNFTSYRDDGTAVTLKDMRGKPTVVNFFASWCGPCRMEMPYFEECYIAYGEQINFMMVNLCAFGNDTKEAGKKMVEEGGYTFPVYFDSDGDAAMGYAIRSMPTTIFVAADGELMGRHTGMIDKATLEATVMKMLEEAQE